MAKGFAKWFYNSKAWKKCREEFISKRIAIDGGMCELCHEQLGYIVHHKVRLNESNINDVYVTLNHSNMQYVCKGCHDKEHYHDIHKTNNKAICCFDEYGQPKPIPP